MCISTFRGFDNTNFDITDFLFKLLIVNKIREFSKKITRKIINLLILYSGILLSRLEIRNTL